MSESVIINANKIAHAFGITSIIIIIVFLNVRFMAAHLTRTNSTQITLKKQVGQAKRTGVG